METKTRFNLMFWIPKCWLALREEQLVPGEVAQATGICTLAGAMIGSLVASVAGTWAGGILGAQYCTGIWAIARSL
mgnify:CR=1 FL=1